MTVKVKGRPVLEENGKLVRVNLETSEGKEYEFCAKTEHVLDEKVFKSLLGTWDRMIREKEAKGEMSEEDIGKVLKKREKMTSGK